MSKVTIERWPDKWGRGRKKILVDGKHWGSIFMESHGCHGPDYWFRQEVDGRDGYALHDPKDLGYKMQPREIRVRAPSKHERRNSWGKIERANVDGLLLDKAKEIVKRKLLRDPAVVRLEQDETHERYLASVKKEEEDRRTNDVLTARNILGVHTHGHQILSIGLLEDAIADAIAKARREP